LEIISTHTWKSFQRALGNPFNGHLEIVTTHTWKSLQRLIGNLYNGSLEILSTAHWKSFQRTLGNLYNGSLEIVSTGTWKSFQRTLGNLNLTTVNLSKLSVAHSKSPLRFFEIRLCSFCDQPLAQISTLRILDFHSTALKVTFTIFQNSAMSFLRSAVDENQYAQNYRFP